MQINPRLAVNDTIVARSTAAGPGAIAIVRVSGAQARAIVAKLAQQAVSLLPYQMRRTALFGRQGEPLDDALVVLMPGPRSYTGEDLLELHLHGGPSVVSGVLAACEAAGARPAEPGEFTLRAFLHGRLDLAQAEAVGALVHAEDEAQRLGALAVLGGGLSNRVTTLMRELQGLLAAWLAGLDFPDDTPGVAEVSPAQVAVWRAAAAAIGNLGDRVRAEAQAQQGVVLLGAVNVGKSTLVNAWAKAPRALVDASPGTTRDLIEVPLVRRGVRFSVWDTAGQRPTADGVEARGIGMAMAQAERAAWVVWLVDAAAPQWPPAALQAARAEAGTLWLVGARADLYGPVARQQLQEAAQARGTPLHGWVSGQASTAAGQDGAEAADVLAQQLGAALARQTAARLQGGHDVALANDRHLTHLAEAQAALAALDAAHGDGMPLDILLVELQGAVRALGRILGQDVDASVIDRIFNDFCIGK